ncbi:hypothetical protein KCU65_g4169, partial [Aureobasidium melanogenum]
MATAVSDPPSAMAAAVEDEYLAKEMEELSDYLIEDLREYLDGINTTGRFATMKKLDHVIDPQVRLLGANNTPEHEISIPLGSRDALKLIEAAHQAPFGRGEETIVDTSVRNTWEISPDRFSLGEHWQEYVDSIIKMACVDLGGAMFKRHADSEKVPGMFATLVISLPSAHWGGAVVVSHNGQRYSLQTQNHEYLAWYSDVLHEVQEVTSGYRWVLTYNLVQTDFEHFNSAAGTDRRLCAILTEWNNTIEEETVENDKMIYQLDHKYTDASIRLNTLKGADLLKAQRLFSVCDQMQYSLYLASLEKQVHGSAEYSNGSNYYSHYDDEEDEGGDAGFRAIEDVIEESLKLTRVVDIDGSVLVTDLNIEEEDLLMKQFYSDRHPDEHEYEGWTGNAGATSTHWYKDSVLVLIPNAYVVDVFLGQDRDYGYGTGRDTKVMAVLEHLAERARAFPGSQGGSLRKSLVRLGYIVSDNRITTKICAEFGLIEILRVLSSAFKDNLSQKALESLSALKDTMDLGLPEDRTRLETIFGKVVLGHKSVSKKYDVLSFLLGAEALDVQNQEDCMPELRAWVTGILATMFSNLDSLTSEDGDVIARMATSDTSGTLLKDRIIPNIERQMQGSDPAKTTFMIAFLAKIFERSELLSENLSSIYRPLVNIVVTNFSLRKSQPLQPRPTYTYGAYGASRVHQDTRKPALDGQVLAKALGYLMDSQLNDYGQLLITRVIAETATMDPQDYEHTIVPFLKGIITRLIDGKDGIVMYEDLFQTCLSQYIFRFVGQEPVQINWSRNPVRCNCRDYMDLNAFLRSPVDRVKQIRVSKQRRHHLHSQLDAYTDCTHITAHGYIETMVVTKQGKSFEEKLKTWTSKAKSALTALRSLEDQEATSSSPSQLRKLLGNKYADIMALRTVRIMAAAQQQPSQPMRTPTAASSSTSNAATAGASMSTATQSNIPQVAGRKRKAVVIDLTDD